MKKRPLFYIESLLSLFMLFVCCSFFILFDDYKYQTAMTAFNYSEHATKWLPFEVHPDRRYTTIQIVGDLNKDIKTINSSVVLIRELESKGDTLKGIMFEFTKTAKYESFIKVLDVCYQENPKFFMMKDNNIWVCNMSGSDSLDMKRAWDKNFKLVYGL